MVKKKVIIVGGGFGGLNVAKILGDDESYSVLLLDRRNYHLFQPLLYQVAMAALSPAEIAVPIRAELSKYKNIDVLMANVHSVDLQSRKIITDAGEYDYDVLILACGAKHSYFGHEEWEQFAPGLKTLEQATEIRRRVLMAFELADREKDLELRKQLLTFVIVGGGPTGVELAGAIGEISRYTLSKDFKHITPESARVVLVEAGDRILAAFDPTLSISAARSLETLGVQVWTSSRVTNISSEGIAIGTEFLKSRTVLWAAGVQPSSINKTLGVALDSGGRVLVDVNLNIPGHTEVYVIGDQANAKDKNDQPLPGLSPVAIQQGRYVARTLKALARGKTPQAFHYLDKGIMATIGRKQGILQVGSIKLSGFIAWLGWLFVHIYYLIGFKNRLFVFVQWAWHYMSFGRGARLIVHKEWMSYNNKGE
ncbi:MAG: NAD(P)/FAD-dependent oxidoreductase [Xanthomonadaceae bacterium]|nr:NAD(P)/FAD-dependent oxidoreductase [Xanthomonadaceae bacterium]